MRCWHLLASLRTNLPLFSVLPHPEHPLCTGPVYAVQPRAATWDQHRNHLESWLNQGPLSPTGVSDPAGLRWGLSTVFAFLTSSQVLLVLLIRGYAGTTVHTPLDRMCRPLTLPSRRACAFGAVSALVDEETKTKSQGSGAVQDLTETPCPSWAWCQGLWPLVLPASKLFPLPPSRNCSLIASTTNIDSNHPGTT